MTSRKKPAAVAEAMTAEEFKAIRIAVGLTQAQAAKVLGYKFATRVSNLEAGQKPIPPLLDRLMRAYAAGYRPADWPQETKRQKEAA